MKKMAHSVKVLALYFSLLWCESLCESALPKDGDPDIQGKDIQNPAEEHSSEELWLEDYTNRKDLLQEMQADAAFGVPPNFPKQDEGFQCPPPEDGYDGGCNAPVCSSDEECRGDYQRCCNNGCVFTCLETMSSPPVVDWVKEPPRRKNSVTSWLVSGPDTRAQVDTCSTSVIWESDEDPLLCPEGFVCHIEFAGDPENGVPNEGRCIKEDAKTKKTMRTGNARKRQDFHIKSGKHKEGGCVIETSTPDKKKTIIPDGDTFPYHRHICECHQGEVSCIVGRPSKES